MDARETIEENEAAPAGVRWVIALVLAIAAMGACGYRFGLSDQLQYLSHYVSIRWPGSLEGDAYLRAFAALGSFLWTLMAMIPPAALPAASAGVTVLICFVSALALISLGRSMSRPGLGAWGSALAWAAPAMALVVPKEQNYFGLVSLADVELTATLAVLPLVFGSMTMFVRGRVGVSLALGVLAAPIHGQTAAYILAAWCAGVILCDRDNPRRLFAAVGVGVIGLVGVAFALRLGPVEPGSLDDYQRLGRELYAPLIDLRSVPVRSWLALVLVLAFGACALPAFAREGSMLDPARRSARRRLVLYGLGALAFPVLGGALLSLGVREPLLWRLMVPRSLMLVQIVSITVCALWACDRARLGGRDGLAGIVVLIGMIVWPVPGAGRLVAGVLGALIVLLILGASLARPHATLPRTRRSSGVLLAGALGVSVLAGVVGWMNSGYAWLRTSAPEPWREAQVWAQANTPEGSVFITPPYLAGWRIDSHRPTFGELRDGGLLFYSGQPALEWEDRMRLLGMDSMRAWWWDVEPGTDDPYHSALRERYGAAINERFNEIAARADASYIVVEQTPDPAWGEPVWSSDAFVIVRVSTQLE